MSADYESLLTATVEHLQNLKSQGVRYVSVESETLKALGRSSAGQAPVKQNIQGLAPQRAIKAVIETTPVVETRPSEVKIEKSVFRGSAGR